MHDLLNLHEVGTEFLVVQRSMVCRDGAKLFHASSDTIDERLEGWDALSYGSEAVLNVQLVRLSSRSDASLAQLHNSGGGVGHLPCEGIDLSLPSEGTDLSLPSEGLDLSLPAIYDGSEGLRLSSEPSQSGGV